MTRNKKIFAGFAVLFLLLLLYASYDIATRTTFPSRGRAKPPTESDKRDGKNSDSTSAPLKKEKF